MQQIHLSVERIIVEEVGAVELLAVGLCHGDHVLLASEYLNLMIVMKRCKIRHCRLPHLPPLVHSW